MDEPVAQGEHEGVPWGERPVSREEYLGALCLFVVFMTLVFIALDFLFERPARLRSRRLTDRALPNRMQDG